MLVSAAMPQWKMSLICYTGLGHGVDRMLGSLNIPEPGLEHIALPKYIRCAVVGHFARQKGLQREKPLAVGY